MRVVCRKETVVKLNNFVYMYVYIGTYIRIHIHVYVCRYDWTAYIVAG